MRRKGRLIAAMLTAFVVLPLALGLLFVFQKNGFGQHSGDGEQVKEASSTKIAMVAAREETAHQTLPKMRGLLSSGYQPNL